MAVDRGLGVGVDVIEQREALYERMEVRGDRASEEGEGRIAVAARVVAEHLVVGAVLADDVEDVLDRAAGADRGVGGRGPGIGGNHLPVADRGQLADLAVARIVQDAGGPVDDRGQVLVEIGVVAGVRVRPVRVGADTKPAGRDPDELAALRRRRGDRGVGARSESSRRAGTSSPCGRQTSSCPSPCAWRRAGPWKRSPSCPSSSCPAACRPHRSACLSRARRRQRRPRRSRRRAGRSRPV